MMNYSEKHSKLSVYPITCHKWNLKALVSTVIGCQRITCSKIMHLSFFTCLVCGTNNATLPVEFCQRRALISVQRSKNRSTLYCLLSKTYSSSLKALFKKHSVRTGWVMQKSNTQCYQGKNDSANEPDVPSPPNSCQENSSDRSEDESVNSPTQPASTENSVQEIYPWMKEFRSKGTKQGCCWSFVLKNVGKR